MRQIPIPQQLEITETPVDLLNAFQRCIKNNNIKRLVIFSSRSSYKLFVEDLIKDLLRMGIKANSLISEEVSLQSPLDCDWIAGVGGGRVLDQGKLLASKLGVNFISVPTLISHDGICSPVAVVHGKSLPAIMPSALIVPLDIIASADRKYIQAGIGDLMSNLSAIQDWHLASKFNNEIIDDFAILLSKQAAMNVVQALDVNPDISDKRFLRILVESLALSGIAMSIAGNSRPCSGAEHMISHAIDLIYGHGTKALHGIQVLIATLFLEREFHQVDLITEKPLSLGENSYLMRLCHKLNLPTSFEELEIDNLESILKLAPETRSGRYTVLAKQNLLA